MQSVYMHVSLNDDTNYDITQLLYLSPVCVNKINIHVQTYQFVCLFSTPLRQLDSNNQLWSPSSGLYCSHMSRADV